MTPTLNPTIAAINAGALAYLPAVLAGVQAAESVPGATGAQKAAAVIGAVSAGLEGSANPNIAGIAALVNLTVSILNGLGVFNHGAKHATA